MTTQPAPLDPLKIAAYCVYLLSWLAFAIFAVLGAIPKLGKPQGGKIQAPAVIGTMLQAVAAIATTRLLPEGPLQARPFELVGSLLLAPLGSALFVWALRSAPSSSAGPALATQGAYARLRHPMYLAFLALLIATGFLISARMRLSLPVMLYLAGTELRIFCEERELAERFPEDFARYRRQTRWLYLPGLR